MNQPTSFQGLINNSNVLSALTDLGYETPTPIQEQSIPILMDGSDIVAQAQTGTGKTAAFALPVLSQLDLDVKKPQALIMAPTRELAIQVAEAFRQYAAHLKGFQVTPIYGGQDYQIQLRALKRGSHIIVGTPGRVMDHMRRGTLDVSGLKSVILDEGDEMLRMGFVDDIEWILEQIPHAHQTALFSATMPARIQKIAKQYLKNPKKIHIKADTATVDTIDQRCIYTTNNQKFDLLTRFLEVENFDAVMIFSRTKTGTVEVADQLQMRGFSVAALNGDIKQSQREKVINRLKNGALNIIVATDVAARGIDVDRITHVFNYDAPCDAESYVHRIGRTGRAGRTGKAFLFVGPREKRLLNEIETTINKTIPQMQPPTVAEIKTRRNSQLMVKVSNILDKSKRLGPFQEMIDSLMDETEYSARDMAAALAYLIEQDNPIPEFDLAEVTPEESNGKKRRRRAPSNAKRGHRGSERRRSAGEKDKPSRQRSAGGKEKPKKRSGKALSSKGAKRAAKNKAAKGKRR